MNIGEVFSRSWEIIWKYKVLWIFGLLAGLTGGSGGNNFRYNLEQSGRVNISPDTLPAWAIGLLVLLFLALLVVLIVVSTLGRAGLVRGAWLADSGETNLTFSRLFRESQPYFARVLLLGILVVAVAVALLLVLIVPSILTCGIALICLVPFFILLSVIVELAIVAIVGEDLSIIDSLRRAWEIVRANLALVIAVSLVIVIASSVIGFVVSLPLIAILAPAAALVSSNAGQASNTALIVSFFLFLFYLPILLGAQAIITTYVETVWTTAFRRLTGRPAGSAIAVPAEPVSIL